MADHYDVPQGWVPPVLVRSPNLGQPRIVAPRPDQVLRVVVGVLDPEVDVAAHLRGRVFLQPLADTRRFVQDAVRPVATLGSLPLAACTRVVPLAVERVDDPVRSDWPWGRTPASATTYPWARWVTLRLPHRLPPWLRGDALFNLVHDVPGVGWFNVNFHAVYLRDRPWDDFQAIHVTDSHVAWRNDTICDVLEPAFPAIRDHFVNFNQSLRDFITFANARHREGTLDAVVLTGDLVDFVHENYAARHGRTRKPALGLRPEPHHPRPIDNLELFRDLMVGWSSHPGVIVGDELEVPLFTVLGNHDYRPNEYPLIHTLHLTVAGIDLSSLHPDPIREYSAFRLTEDQACAYEGGIPHLDSDVAASFVEYTTAPPTSYRALVNPDADWVAELGPHRLVGLDTGHDDGVVTSILDYLLRSGAEKIFIEGSPNSVGFGAEQVALLATQARATEGLLLIACHSPLVNMRSGPHHLLREAEHVRPFSAEQRGEEAAFVLTNHPEATELENYPHLVSGGGNLVLTGDPVSSGIMTGITYLITWLGGEPWKSPIDKLREEGWRFGGSREMKAGARDPYLGWGVASHRFQEFLAALEGRPGAGATLVLSGHTHQSVEYVVTRGGGSTETRFHHDYYVDNTIHGRRPQDYWCSEALPDSAWTVTPGTPWWRAGPLFIQTMSIGPRPAGMRPDRTMAAPYGRARVRAGRFVLHDLEPGTYLLHLVSDDRRVSAVSEFAVSGAAAPCGEAEITLRLTARNGIVPPLTGTDHTDASYAVRELDHGSDVTVDGWARSPGGAPLSGTVHIARAAPATGGGLEVVVRGGAIERLRRRSLAEMRLVRPAPCTLDVAVMAALGIIQP